MQTVQDAGGQLWKLLGGSDEIDLATANTLAEVALKSTQLPYRMAGETEEVELAAPFMSDPASPSKTRFVRLQDLLTRLAVQKDWEQDVTYLYQLSRAVKKKLSDIAANRCLVDTYVIFPNSPEKNLLHRIWAVVANSLVGSVSVQVDTDYKCIPSDAMKETLSPLLRQQQTADSCMSPPDLVTYLRMEEQERPDIVDFWRGGLYRSEQSQRPTLDEGADLRLGRLVERVRRAFHAEPGVLSIDLSSGFFVPPLAIPRDCLELILKKNSQIEDGDFIHVVQQWHQYLKCQPEGTDREVALSNFLCPMTIHDGVLRLEESDLENPLGANGFFARLWRAQLFQNLPVFWQQKELPIDFIASLLREGELLGGMVEPVQIQVALQSDAKHPLLQLVLGPFCGLVERVPGVSLAQASREKKIGDGAVDGLYESTYWLYLGNLLQLLPEDGYVVVGGISHNNRMLKRAAEVVKDSTVDTGSCPVIGRGIAPVQFVDVQEKPVLSQAVCLPVMAGCCRSEQWQLKTQGQKVFVPEGTPPELVVAVLRAIQDGGWEPLNSNSCWTTDGFVQYIEKLKKRLDLLPLCADWKVDENLWPIKPEELSGLCDFLRMSPKKGLDLAAFLLQASELCPQQYTALQGAIAYSAWKVKQFHPEQVGEQLDELISQHWIDSQTGTAKMVANALSGYDKYPGWLDKMGEIPDDVGDLSQVYTALVECNVSSLREMYRQFQPYCRKITFETGQIDCTKGWDRLEQVTLTEGSLRGLSSRKGYVALPPSVARLDLMFGSAAAASRGVSLRRSIAYHAMNKIRDCRALSAQTVRMRVSEADMDVGQVDKDHPVSLWEQTTQLSLEICGKVREGIMSQWLERMAIRFPNVEQLQFSFGSPAPLTPDMALWILDNMPSVKCLTLALLQDSPTSPVDWRVVQQAKEKGVQLALAGSGWEKDPVGVVAGRLFSYTESK